MQATQNEEYMPSYKAKSPFGSVYAIKILDVGPKQRSEIHRCLKRLCNDRDRALYPEILCVPPELYIGWSDGVTMEETQLTAFNDARRIGFTPATTEGCPNCTTFCPACMDLHHVGTAVDRYTY